MGGKADYQPAPGYEQKLHAIGPKGNPVWIGKKGDVPGLLTDLFWIVFHTWQQFHLGFPAPDPDTWLAEMVARFEGQYRANFSTQRQILDQLHALVGFLAQKPVR